jgi:putative molybdopterin biosynthesis protein
LLEFIYQFNDPVPIKVVKLTMRIDRDKHSQTIGELMMNAVSQKRKSSGLSQTELAQRCGISRQFLSLMESGKTQPNVQIAIHMAKVLQCNVEQLFELEADLKTEVPVVLLDDAPVKAGTRLSLGNVKGNWVAQSVDTETSLALGFAASDGILKIDQNRLSASLIRKPEELASNLVISGCDPALNLIKDYLKSKDSRLIVHICGSEQSLNLLETDRVHMAGFHFPEFNGKGNLDHLTALHRINEKAVFRFSSWELGWMVSEQSKNDFRGVEDFSKPRIRFANREPGSGARVWFDNTLKNSGIPGDLIPGYEVEYTTHYKCAEAVKTGITDVALGPRAVAEIMELHFIPVVEFPFDIVLDRKSLSMPQMSRFLDELNSARFQNEMSYLSGYNAGKTGQRLL